MEGMALILFPIIFWIHVKKCKKMKKVYVIGIRFQIELTKISVTKGWSDQVVNAQIDKDINP